MGCDIHFHVERRTPNGLWKHIGGDWYAWRSYELFAKLADVRNDRFVQPLATPRGLPGNASRAVLRDAKKWGDDGHSHSWFTLAELLAVEWDDSTYGAPWTACLQRMVELAPDELESVRAVFWFDN